MSQAQKAVGKAQAEEELRLIEAARRKDLSAFNRLVEIYQGVVYNLAYRVMGDAEDAADATQEAFLSAFQAIGGFRGGSFRGWLLRITTNACYDQLRARGRRPTSSLEAVLVETDAGVPPTDWRASPEEHAARRELLQRIQEGINALPMEQRMVVVLSDIQGLSYEEIAEVTRTSLGTVKSRLSRGRARLRDFLLEERELLPSEFRPKK